MTHFLADDGEKIHVQVSGEGTPLILLHGWTASHHEWSPFISGLSPHHRLFRWDARAHGIGWTAASNTQPTVQRLARDLQNLLDHFGIEQAGFVGHSMGALILWQYLRDFGTQRVSKLCFIDQSPKLMTDDSWQLGVYGDFDRNRSDALIASLNDDFAEAVLKLIAFGLNEKARNDYLADVPAWQKTRKVFRSLTPGPLIACWKSLTEADYRDVLESIDVPTLLIYGTKSNFYVPATAHYVANSIPNALLNIYEGDHSPHLWQRERFIRELLEFLAG